MANLTKDDSDRHDPWYSRLLRAVLDRGGPTGLIALVLVGFLAWAMWNQIALVQGKLDAIHSEILTAKAAMQVFTERQHAWETKREDLLEKQLRLMRTMCINQAKGNEIAWKGCVE